MLERLKRIGEATAQDLGEHTEITTTGARQHLSALERDGLITHRMQRDGRGRPKMVYCLTPVGDGLFPRNYSELTNELLHYVEEEDPQMLNRIFDRRADRRLRDAQLRMEGRPFEEKIATLAQILDQDGYLAEFEQRDDGVFLITEHNCAVLSVAKKYGHACGSELQFLQDALPEATVIRVAHRLERGHVCRYEIRRNALAEPATVA